MEKMKLLTTLVCAFAVLAFAAPALAQNDDVLDEEDVCPVPVMEWEDRLDVELAEQSCEDDWDDEGGGELDAESGDCYVAGSGGRYYLRCDYSGTSTSVTHHIVVGKTSGSDQVRMCASTNGGSTWSLKGYVDRDYTTLKVYGNNGPDNIKIQLTAYNYGTGCNFDAWFTSAQIANLYMIGGDNYDYIYGSNNADVYLQGEYVVGRDGGDHIYLTKYGSTTPYANGEGGADTVAGSAYADYIWGDSGNDTLRGYGGNDEIGGGADNDTIYGGDGDDWIEGGSGNDYLYGDAHCDYLDGQDGYDYCYCGGNSGYGYTCEENDCWQTCY